MTEWLFLVGAGKVVMYMVRLFARSNEIKNRFFVRLFECDFCLGFWVYFCFLCFFRRELTSIFVGYVPLVSEVVSAMLLSFVVSVFSAGWVFHFGVFGDRE